MRLETQQLTPCSKVRLAGRLDHVSTSTVACLKKVYVALDKYLFFYCTAVNTLANTLIALSIITSSGFCSSSLGLVEPLVAVVAGSPFAAWSMCSKSVSSRLAWAIHHTTREESTKSKTRFSQVLDQDSVFSQDTKGKDTPRHPMSSSCWHFENIVLDVTTDVLSGDEQMDERT